MKDCTTCRWDNGYSLIVRISICQQGHVRVLSNDKEPIIVLIKDCHSWEKKEECECHKVEEDFYLCKMNLITLFNLICKKCGRIVE